MTKKDQPPSQIEKSIIQAEDVFKEDQDPAQQPKAQGKDSKQSITQSNAQKSEAEAMKEKAPSAAEVSLKPKSEKSSKKDLKQSGPLGEMEHDSLPRLNQSMDERAQSKLINDE